MKLHKLKTWPEPYRQVVNGLKPFEVRIDDRGFLVGDLLLLEEFVPSNNTYTGEQHLVEVTTIVNTAGPIQLPDNVVVLGIRPPFEGARCGVCHYEEGYHKNFCPRCSKSLVDPSTMEYGYFVYNRFVSMREIQKLMEAA